MGSFNFKQAPYYKEKSCQFIGQTSKNILPLPALQGDIGVDITQLPISKNITKIEGKLAFPLSSLGLLRAKHPQSNKVIDGTCALIAPKLLLTCAHNLYSYKQKMHYSEVEYFPSRNGIESTKIRIKITEQRVRIHPNFIEYETSQHEHFDYAIIMLEQSLEDACGCMEVAVNYKIKEQDDIYLFGYPVEENNIKHEVNLYGARGNIKKITQNIIFYDMQTAAGQSGAPLFIQHQGKWKIIGIHTISDPSGIYINTNVANTINSWINQQESALVVEDGSKIFGQKWPKLQKMVRKYTWESLVELTFNGCNITSQNLAHLNKLNWNIRILTLDHNKIDSICLDPAKFRPLQKLSLNNNVITRLDGSINGFKRLAILSLQNNRISKVDVVITSKIIKIMLHGNKCEFGQKVDKGYFQF